MRFAFSFLARMACAACAIFAWGTLLQIPLAVTAFLCAGAYLFFKLDVYIVAGKEDVIGDAKMKEKGD
ncbi:MAG: hypothetical protein GXY32_11485 [Ruminococcaceae bacterium]|nr:hypothetical protein [Oscillospiraceae bacterium]